jgi:hypothetical protein
MDDYRKYFRQFVVENYPKDFENILADTDRHYNIISRDTAFAKTSKNPIDRRLDFSSYFLALIKTLDEKSETFENIRIICLQITTEYVQNVGSNRARTNLCFKKNGRHPTNKDFPRGQVNGFADNLDLKKLKRGTD